MDFESRASASSATPALMKSMSYGQGRFGRHILFFFCPWLPLFSQVTLKAAGCLIQVLLTHNIVSVEDGSCLPSADCHDYPLGHSRAHQISGPPFATAHAINKTDTEPRAQATGQARATATRSPRLPKERVAPGSKKPAAFSGRGLLALRRNTPSRPRPERTRGRLPPLSDTRRPYSESFRNP